MDRAGRRRPGLVPPPSHDVYYPAESPQHAIENWRKDVTASHQLAAATRELLRFTGDNEAQLRTGLDDADRALRAVPAPPMVAPSSTQDGATAWQDLQRFPSGRRMNSTARWQTCSPPRSQAGRN